MNFWRNRTGGDRALIELEGQSTAGLRLRRVAPTPGIERIAVAGSPGTLAAFDKASRPAQSASGCRGVR